MVRGRGVNLLPLIVPNLTLCTVSTSSEHSETQVFDLASHKWIFFGPPQFVKIILFDLVGAFCSCSGHFRPALIVVLKPRLYDSFDGAPRRTQPTQSRDRASAASTCPNFMRRKQGGISLNLLRQGAKERALRRNQHGELIAGA